VLAEIGGSLRLFGGLPQIADQFAQGAHDLGYAARLAFAPTPTAALLFARTGQSALAPLPLSQLDVEPEVIEFLAAAGITTFGQACALPRDALARRVGAAFVVTLDRARGLTADPRPPFVPPPRYEGKLELPATIENVEALARLAEASCDVAGLPAKRDLATVLPFARERYVGGAPIPLLSCTGLAARRVIRASRRRAARATGAGPLPAPVIALVLASEETAPAGRTGLLPGDEAQCVPLLDRLRARLGEDAVIRVMQHRHRRAHGK
jgi:protein ImuB